MKRLRNRLFVLLLGGCLSAGHGLWAAATFAQEAGDSPEGSCWDHPAARGRARPSRDRKAGRNTAPSGGRTHVVYVLPDGRIQRTANVYAVRYEVDEATYQRLFPVRRTVADLLRDYDTGRRGGNR